MASVRANKVARQMPTLGNVELAVPLCRSASFD